MNTNTQVAVEVLSIAKRKLTEKKEHYQSIIAEKPSNILETEIKKIDARLQEITVQIYKLETPEVQTTEAVSVKQAA